MSEFSTLHVGLDVHKESIDIAVAEPDLSILALAMTRDEQLGPSTQAQHQETLFVR